MIPIVLIVLMAQFICVALMLVAASKGYMGTADLLMIGVYLFLGIIIGLAIAPGLEQWDTATRSIVVTPS
jgi:hypothetical protein